MYVDQIGIGADDVSDRRKQAAAGPVRQSRRALEQQWCLIPHQLAAPDSVRRTPHRADVVTPDLRRGEVGLALVERVEQAQNRFVFDALEPLPRLRRLAGGRQVLKELPGSPATPVARRDSTSSVLPLRCDASTR